MEGDFFINLYTEAVSHIFHVKHENSVTGV